MLGYPKKLARAYQTFIWVWRVRGTVLQILMHFTNSQMDQMDLG